MQSAAEQSNGNRPVIQLSGYTFQRVAVDSVQAADGTTYETLFIAAHRSGEFNVPYQVKAHIVCLVRVVIWQHNALLSKGCIDMFDGISRVEHVLQISLDKQQKSYNIPLYSPSGNIVLLKVTYIPSRVGDKFHISQSVVLEPGQASGPETIYRSPPRDITQMKLRGTGPQAQVYVGTTTGIYRVPTSQCGDYTDCCSCIEARDPYCAFDSTLLRCVAVEDGNRGSGSLVQDVVNGNVTMCAVLPVAGTSPPTPSPTSAGEEVTTSPAGGDGESTSGELI